MVVCMGVVVQIQRWGMSSSCGTMLSSPRTALVLMAPLRRVACGGAVQLLGMMQPIYRNLGRYDEATKAYEKFAADDPSNPERQIQLFNAYAREYDYLKQQQVGPCFSSSQGDSSHLAATARSCSAIANGILLVSS